VRAYKPAEPSVAVRHNAFENSSTVMVAIVMAFQEASLNPLDRFVCQHPIPSEAIFIVVNSS
jgi:hypothetical protein